MFFKEKPVKVQGHFPEHTTHARYVYETEQVGPQNDKLTLGAPVAGEYLLQLHFPHWYV